MPYNPGYLKPPGDYRTRAWHIEMLLAMLSMLLLVAPATFLLHPNLLPVKNKASWTSCPSERMTSCLRHLGPAVHSVEAGASSASLAA